MGACQCAPDLSRAQALTCTRAPQAKSHDVRGNKDYLESGWVGSDAEAEKVIASYQEQYEAATGGEGAQEGRRVRAQEAQGAQGQPALHHLLKRWHGAQGALEHPI